MLRGLPAVVLVIGLAGVVMPTLTAAAGSAADACAAGNAIVCENAKPGNPSSQWEIVGKGSSTVEGFATDISVDAGTTVKFKVHAESDYTMKIYRMGYYGGAGAREIATLTADAAVSKANQPSSCANNSDSTGLVDCGNWGVSASWAVPATAVSGIYFARLERISTGDDNHIPFIVRHDSSHSDVLFQTSDTTWQAYNNWGGNSLYAGAPAGRAYKVSYNRPFNTRSTPNGRDFVWGSEYPMVRFLEANGYDVSYSSGVDTDRLGSLLTNHKTFLSVGHDEYWSGDQRANVERARDAGVNLAFFSGNEVYWKTRYEPGVDASKTPYRTLVTYKSTHDDSQTDPTGVWTGTWRDPRFSPPADGGRPENALTGTMTTAIEGTRAIKVPADEGKLRLWRNTSVASLGAGQTATLPAGTLGYEWNSDVDNGFRPPGAVRLSDSTYDVEQRLTDYGSQTAPGTARHHLMLYRAGSGALVFGAGTVQWSWGLDEHHDGDGEAPDQRMRQATVNLLADMSAQPGSLQSDLTRATKSADTTPASAVITSPAAGAALSSGTPITVTGTATDVGGRVGGVEVSLDGGHTWHSAAGRESWSYDGIVGRVGATTVQARASDDSGNLQSSPAQRPVSVSCPCAMFDGEKPAIESGSDRRALELGVRFRPELDGYITGVRFWKGAGNTGVHTGSLWTFNGTRRATGTFVSETDSGWQTLVFPVPVAVTAGTEYVASYFAPNGGYASTASYFLGKDAGAYPLTAPRATTASQNGVFLAGSPGFPTSGYRGVSYWVSPVFDIVKPADTAAPTVTQQRPVDTASSVAMTVKPEITFDEPIADGSLTLLLRSDTGLVPGTTTLSDDRQKAVFSPSAPLISGTTYTLSSTGGTDDAGNAFTGLTSTFRTAQVTTPGVCPCSVWWDTDVPTTRATDDDQDVELGVRFTAGKAGYVTGVRFYKGATNTGTHTGTLWSPSGTQLAHATFTNESAAGWQEVRFDTKVPVTAGQVYTASYHTAGHYALTAGGLNSDVVNDPLTAVSSAGSGGNGVYRYGAHALPDNNGRGADYGVDVVFENAADITAPAVTEHTPPPGTANVRTGTVPRVTFSEKVVSGLTVTLKADSTAVGVTAGLDTAGLVATLTPASPLEAGRTYTVTVSGAKDAAGNVMTPYKWSFSTSGTETCPCGLYPGDQVPSTVDSRDASPLELGVRFTPSVNGYVNGVRFYKAAANTGTHVGSLWTSGGALMTSATFGAESDSGWQQVSFGFPVAVQAGTTYIVSYTAPEGRYSADPGQFRSAWQNGPLTAPADRAGVNNGLYSTLPGRFPTRSYNATGYAVDPVFTPSAGGDSSPPVLLSTDPVDGAVSVPVNRSLTAWFDEPQAAGSVRADITGPGSSVVASTVSVGADNSVTVTPSSALQPDTRYTIRINGSDLAGNALRNPVTWSYRTAKAAGTACPCSLWSDGTEPAVASADERRAVELGVKFTPEQDGRITGVRFYKGPDNVGTHVGTLWSATGAELARATFGPESSAGWQEVTFAQPVDVTAGRTYVAGYHTDTGGYAYTLNGFAGMGVARGPLGAPIGTTTDPNGVYAYGALAFPSSGRSTNYWVDVLFQPKP
ncbi:DUF4082 domain-containing protein [Kineosporia mesophila]|uniref:DUF4082 domain-containing protein n=1 Tax=Kineosporia mesophila TaxID=566012 RepID=UPI001E3C4B75|nr:DUF4082 domain-containing protein [Kineosporia mesophila]MCD5350978.1 DUF4082 domain-containing protein [Kineosporia mesophila]